MTALEFSQLAANYATVANMGAACAALCVSVLGYFALCASLKKKREFTSTLALNPLHAKEFRDSARGKTDAAG